MKSVRQGKGSDIPNGGFFAAVRVHDPKEISAKCQKMSQKVSKCREALNRAGPGRSWPVLAGPGRSWPVHEKIMSHNSPRKLFQKF